MRCCKIAAGLLFLLLTAILLSACASPEPPAEPDAAKSRMLDLGWNLSYIEDSAELSDLVSGFDFDCKDGLTAYLVAKDNQETTLLEVLFFRSENDARSALEMLSGKLSDPDTYGSSGSQVWYGTKSAVSKYLG